MSGTQSKNLQLVKVYVRQRPLTRLEIETKRQNVVQCLTKNEISLKAGATEKKYCFDGVFNKTSSQVEIYNEVVHPMIEFVLSGYTCTVFAYGQTGTGKTYTMIGQEVGSSTDFSNDPSVGIVPRAAMHIYTELQKLNVEHTVRVSFIEIYNEEVRDLLVNDGVPLKVYDDPDNKGATCVKGVSEKTVTNVEDVYKLLAIGSVERQTASTKLNRLSSRSHTLFTIVVNTREVTPEGEEVITTGKLHMVDLAGSENIGRSGATDMRAREAGSINKSLLTLGKVIKALAQKMQHVPYRESKLTRILQDSLGGKSKTCMIATFAPCIDSFDETLSTLDYAHVARSVANCPTVNVNRKQTNVLKESQEELLQLRQELNAARAGEGFYMNPSSYEKINFDIKSKSERILNLTQEIARMEQSISEKQKLYDELSLSHEETNSVLEDLKKVLKEENYKLKQYRFSRDVTESLVLELKQIAQNLYQVCEKSTKHEDIFYKKYELLCELNLNNANVAKNIHSLAATCLNKIWDSSENSHHLQKIHLDDARESIKTINDLDSKNLERFERILTDLNLRKEHWELNSEILFKDTVYSEDQLLKRIRSFFESSCKTQLKSLDEAEMSAKSIRNCAMEQSTKIEARLNEWENLMKQQFTEDKENATKLQTFLPNFQASLGNRRKNLQQQLARAKRIKDLHGEILQEIILDTEDKKRMIETTRSLQKDVELLDTMSKDAIKPWANMKQTLDDICVLEPMEVLLPVVQDEINAINSSRKICETAIGSFKKEAEEYCDGFSKTFESKVIHNDNDFLNVLEEWTKELEATAESLHEVTGHLNYMDEKSDMIMSTLKVREDDLKQFIQKSTKDLEDLSKNVKAQVHAGDTPVKAVLEYPKVIPTLPSKATMQEQYRRLFPESSTDLA